MEAEKLLLTSDVARLLDCSTDNVRALERNGQLRAVRTESGVRLFDRRDVELFQLQRVANRTEIRSARR